MPTAVQKHSPDPFDEPPYVLSWGNGYALPEKIFSGRSRGNVPPPAFSPDLLPTGSAHQPFDFCGHVQRLCASIVSRCEELYHVDIARVLFAATPARNGRAAGLQARVTPMRFAAGAVRRRQFGRDFQVQRFRYQGREILYVMTFCLPRFLDQTFEEKFITIFHELFHIGPSFDGDLRRHAGRYEVHTHSQREYDARMGEQARAYLAGAVDHKLHAFLRLSFDQLCRKHGGIRGATVPRPKLLPLPAPVSPTQY